ncbi:MAG: phosphate acyltransferase [Bacilli bacterium]
MALVQRLSARLQNHPKRIVFPEGFDQRILQAARQFATRKLGVPILLGDKAHIESKPQIRCAHGWNKSHNS